MSICRLATVFVLGAILSAEPRERHFSVEFGQGRIAGYHCWAEFYATGIGWIPIDASEAAKDPSRRDYFFGAHDENRVEFTRGRDLKLAPLQAGGSVELFCLSVCGSGREGCGECRAHS
jgi:hypothetical protein